MYRPDGIIIDNNKLKLSEELNNILREQHSVDIASAYFNTKGFQIIRDSISGIERFRLLIGTSPQIGEPEPDYFKPEELYIW